MPPQRQVLTRNPSLAPLSKLRAFEAAARLGSITGAGEELSVSPGAISRHIKELEAELGVQVLDRVGRGVRLTDDGVRLFRSLQPAFAMISGAMRQAMRDPDRTRLTVMTVPVFASTWLLPRAARFARLAPEVDLIITDRITEEAFGASVADVVIDWGDFGGTEAAVVERLTRERLFPVCAPSSACFRFARRRSVRRTAVSTAPRCCTAIPFPGATVRRTGPPFWRRWGGASATPMPVRASPGG